MFSSVAAAKLEELAGALVMLDENAGEAEWRGLIDLGQELRDKLTAAGEINCADAAQRFNDICRKIVEEEGVNRAEARHHLGGLLNQLQALAEGAGAPAAIKQQIAQADLFLRDLAASSEAVPSEPPLDRELLAELDNRVDGLESLLFTNAGGTTNQEIIRAVFREVHTLKGEAGIVGLKELNQFCHQVESVIQGAREGRLTFTSEVAESLLELTQLARLLLHGDTSGRIAPTVRAAAIQRLETAVAEAKNAPKAVTAPPAQPSVEVAEEEDDFFAAAEEAAAPPTPVAVAPALPVATPSPAAAPGEGPGEAGEEAPAGGESEELPVETESLQQVSLGVDRLDALIELAGEISLLGGLLAQDSELADSPQSGRLQDLARSCRQLEDMTAGLRMTPVRALFQRVRRAAFDAARTSHKRLEVRLEGADTTVDRSLMEPLSGALIHLARNAIDHGLEAPAERRAQGKPEKGTVTLRADRAGADVIIEFADDGKGIDLERLRRKAESVGLVSPEAQLSESETVNLIFRSGLSTAEKVTGLSGRGVGMDAVRESVKSLRGTIEVDNQPGAGVCFRLRLPVSLAAMDGLLVQVGENVLVLPVQSVRESFRVRPEQISTVEGQGTVVNIRGVILPVQSLGVALGLTMDCQRTEDGVLVMIEEGDQLTAVLVDAVLEARPIVARPLEGDLAAVRSVTGAAFLADRRVALVVDTRDLIRRASVNAREAFARASNRQVQAERQVDTVQIGSNQVGMVDFSLVCPGPAGPSRHAFAINAFKTREFVPSAPLTPLPNAPRGFAGLLLLREKTIPIVSLGELLGLSANGAGAEWEKIIVICEFSGRTVGFLATQVNRVSYVSWGDILPPPESGGLIPMDYVVGTIFESRLRQGNGQEASSGEGAGGGAASRDGEVVFVLDFERVVQKVLALYGDIGAELRNVQRRKSNNRILLVEDSSLIRRETRVALQKAGLEVLEAENGEAALAIVNDLYARAQKDEVSIFAYLDLVLSDIEMPRMDGYTLTASLKQHPQLRVLPVLLHSSITNDTMISRAREVEADGFIAKCDPGELGRQLRKYL